MELIPLISAPSQSFSVVLNGQACLINLYTLDTPGDILSPVAALTIDSGVITVDTSQVTIDEGPAPITTALPGVPALYMDLIVAGQPVITGRLATNMIPMLLAAEYYAFEGDLVFIDTGATGAPLTGQNPIFTGLGDQFQLVYLEPADLQ